MSSSTTCPAHAVCPSSKLNKDNIAELELPLIGTSLNPPKLHLHLLWNRHRPSRHHQQSIQLMHHGCLILTLDPVTWVNAGHVSLTVPPPLMMHQMAMLNLLPPHPHNQSQKIPKGRRNLPMVRSLLHFFFSKINRDHWCLDNPMWMEWMLMCMSKSLRTQVTTEHHWPSTKPIQQQTLTNSLHHHQNQWLYQGTRKDLGVKHVNRFFIIGDIIILLIYSLWGPALVDVPIRTICWSETSPCCAGI